MPGRRPAPLSDELFGAGPGPVLLGATNNGMPLPVKNTFLDMPSGLTPASMKHEKLCKGMLSAPADLDNRRSPGFVQRALVAGIAATWAEAKEVLDTAATAPSTAPTLGTPETTDTFELDFDREQSSQADSCSTPPATPVIVASLFQSPGATPAGSRAGQLAELEVALRTPADDLCQLHGYVAPSMASYPPAAWSSMACGLADAPAGMRDQAPEKPWAPVAVPAKAPAQAKSSCTGELAPAEKLLLLEEASLSKQRTGTVGAGRVVWDDEDDEDSDDELQAEHQPFGRALEDVPKPPPGALHPSTGSQSHGSSVCKRCCFYSRGRCLNGYECGFCHYEHDKRRRKNKKKRGKVTSIAIGIEDPAGAKEAPHAVAASATITPLATLPQPDSESVGTSQGTSAPAMSQQTLLGYYQASDTAMSPASMLTGSGTNVYAGTNRHQPFFLYGAPGQSEPAIYQAAPVGTPLLSTGCSGCSTCNGASCASNVGPLGLQVFGAPQAAQGPAPPPMQSPRLQQTLHEFAPPPPPMQSPKLPSDPAVQQLMR